MVWEIVGWTAWAFDAYLAVTHAYGFRKLTASGHGFSSATAVQALFYWILAVTFLLTPWNKLHIIWLLPASFFFGQFIVFGGIPVASPVIQWVTRLFLLLILVRVRCVSGENLIRNLARKRIRNDPALDDIDIDLDGMDSVLLMGLPEATIVWIVQNYWRLKRQGNLSDEEILEAIEARRSKVRAGTMPIPLDLSSYIRYRLNLDHSHGVPISDKFVDEAIEKSNKVFGGGT